MERERALRVPACLPAVVVPKWKSLSLVIVVRCPCPRAPAGCRSTGLLVASRAVSLSREWNSDTTPSITWTEWTPGARKWKTLAARPLPRPPMTPSPRSPPLHIKWIQQTMREIKEKGNMVEREKRATDRRIMTAL